MTKPRAPRTSKRVARKDERSAQSGAAEAPANLSASWRKAFLAKLAETSHVRAACEHAKVHPLAVYDLRRRDSGFRAAWMEALCEGYDNLEMELLHRLRTGRAEGQDKIDNATAFRMLQTHRDNVMKERARQTNVDVASVRASIDRKIAEMRAMILADKLTEDRDAQRDADSNGA